MKIIDWYILKRYLGTFFVMILLFIPIGIMVDLAEKIDKMREKEVPLEEILQYYIDFTWYFANLLFPIFLFLSIIWFTSKLANNTEVIAVLSSGISFNRYLRPFFLGALIIASTAFLAGMFVVPKASLGFNEFRYQYLNKKKVRSTDNVYKQINDAEFIYVSFYDPVRKRGSNFTLEHFKDNQLQHKIMANSIRWLERDSLFRLANFSIRKFTPEGEVYESIPRKDTLLDFKIEDLSPAQYKAETLDLFELNQFIEKERAGGSQLINNHLLVRHKRYSLPVSAFVLTLIAVAMASFKRRGGMGLNLAFGITLGFIFIFFDKIFGVLVNKSNFPPGFAAWIPIFVFGILALYLLNRARK